MHITFAIREVRMKHVGHLAGSAVKHASLDLGVVGLSPTLGAEFT